MLKIRINEKLTTRGMNNLFYQVEVSDFETGKNQTTIEYRRNIAEMLHETPIFKMFKRNEGTAWEDKQCREYCKKLEDVIKLLEKTMEIY